MNRGTERAWSGTTAAIGRVIPCTLMAIQPEVALMVRWIGTLVLLCFIGVGCAAQSAADAPAGPPDPITLELIMSDPEWIGRAPEGAYWADDGRSFYYLQRRAGQSRSGQERDLIQMSLDGTVIRTVADADLAGVDAQGGAWSADFTRKVYTKTGDLFLKDITARAVSQLTRTVEAEFSPRFLVGDDRVTFRRGDAILIRHLATGLEEQVPPVLAGKDPDEKEDEKEDGLAAGERELFGHLREREEVRDAARERERQKRDADATRVAKAFYMGDDVEVRSVDLSPAGEWIAVRVGPKRPDPAKADAMPNYVTETGYVESRQVRGKVGTGKPTTDRLCVIHIASRTKHEIDLGALPGITDDPLKQIKEEAKAWREAKEKAEKEQSEGKATSAGALPEKAQAVQEEDAGQDKAAREEEAAGTTPLPAAEGAEKQPDPETKADDKGKEKPKPRPVRVSSLQWTDDGSRLAFQVFSADNKDRWVAWLDLKDAAIGPHSAPSASTGEGDAPAPAPSAPALQLIEHEHNDAWINTGFAQLGWLPDSRRLWYLSEKSGYSNLYLHNANSKTGGALVSGAFEVSSVSPDRAGRFLYFTSNHPHPGIHECCRVDVDTGVMEQLTDLKGRVADAVPSPDGSHLLVTHSAALRPRELFVQENRPGAAARRVTFTVSEKFLSLSWVAPEFVAIPGPAGPIHSRVYDADNAMDGTDSVDGMDAEHDGLRPAVLFIHGAGYLQNAHQGWSQYFREFMFHSLLARRGYVVLDMDYRASAGYGRDWRTAIYRNMGPPELDDLEAGVEWLVANRNVDRARVGVYGGSYGGFLTLMALFTRPDLFACGAALRPVTDWAHYNDGYTANILNTPADDPVAYERSSPIRHAEGLTKPLLICHGMQDDNVFYQDTVRLAQRLIELGKENWEVAAYPIEPHAFTEPTSWLDEYRRVLRLFEENLRQRH